MRELVCRVHIHRVRARPQGLDQLPRLRRQLHSSLTQNLIEAKSEKKRRRSKNLRLTKYAHRMVRFSKSRKKDVIKLCSYQASQSMFLGCLDHELKRWQNRSRTAKVQPQKILQLLVDHPVHRHGEAA